jgi:1-acyl-sn-glycerol-3-phosphate acyltransferase
MPDEATPEHDVRNPLRGIRGYAALTFVGMGLLVSDLVQRTVVAGAVRLFPRARRRILTRWIQCMRYLVLDLASVKLGGARLDAPARVPSRPGVLVIMNHQSVLDIPLVVRATEGGYPRIITRSRYARKIPVISHMIRLYQYPVVDPKATVRAHLEGLQKAAREGDTSLVIFPEGSRTRSGDLGEWKKTGLKILLRARAWEVHLLVADGMWRSRRLKEWMREVSETNLQLRHAGTFQSPDPDDSAAVDAFIDDMHRHMSTRLSELRAETQPLLGAGES